MMTINPTKGNLIAAKNTLKLSRQGYEMLDRKRNVLIKEIMALSQKAKEIQEHVGDVFADAYLSLQKANITNGISRVENIAHGVNYENSIEIKWRSVMGVEIPILNYKNSTNSMPSYGFGSINSALDRAIYKFNKVKDLIINLAVIENSIYKLAANIKRTQKRANALKNIIIPRYENLVKNIQDILEERDRDEFTRLKVIKRKK